MSVGWQKRFLWPLQFIQETIGNYQILKQRIKNLNDNSCQWDGRKDSYGLLTEAYLGGLSTMTNTV